MQTGYNTGSARWIRLILGALVTTGIVVSILLTQHHENRVYGDATAVLSNCPETETINCDTVNTSRFSELLGVPIAAFAIPTYLLVLLLLWKARRTPRLLAYAFSIGMLTVLYSAFLFYLSSTHIGFICLYCASLYGINLTIPILTALAARRSPGSLLRDTLSDLMGWPRPLRVTACVFLGLLAATIGVQRAYRVHVKKRAAIERHRIEEQGGPLVPAGPDSALLPEERVGAGSLFFPEASAATPGPAPGAGPYRLAGPLSRIEKGAKMEAFDLQSRLGHGRPVALIFWTPGYRPSERLLGSMTRFFKSQLPAFDVYPVAGRGGNQRDEEVLEAATMLQLPRDLPLLIDQDFVLSKALNTMDIPDVALFRADGGLVASRIKALEQKLALPTGGVISAEEVMRKMASGTQVPEIKQMAPYFPAREMVGWCAPEFQAKKFDSGEPFHFTGKPAHPRPLLLMFWSSTCTHCQVEIPLLVSWLKKNPNRIDILSVTRIKPDQPGQASHREITRRYIKQEQITWPVLEDPDGSITELYRNISTPTTFFITPDGTVVQTWLYAHPDNFPAAMETALSQAGKASSGVCKQAPESPGSRLALDMLAANGTKVSLASKLDRPAIVHFWATWCAPCVGELPQLLKFGQSLEKSGTGRLIMISVEDAQSGPRIESFARKLGLQLPTFRTPTGELTQMLDIAYRLPRTYVVAPNGVIVGSWQGSQKWDEPKLAEEATWRLRNASVLAR
ncbi:MAG TPA: redoxin domain-containing protein [Candidatus Polarisedimenticolia bacterium]|nr:redoxin domain-containing protein [Candidatus Polarisedimenticolia bacterium]